MILVLGSPSQRYRSTTDIRESGYQNCVCFVSTFLHLLLLLGRLLVWGHFKHCLQCNCNLPNALVVQVKQNLKSCQQSSNPDLYTHTIVCTDVVTGIDRVHCYIVTLTLQKKSSSVQKKQNFLATLYGLEP